MPFSAATFLPFPQMIFWSGASVRYPCKSITVSDLGKVADVFGERTLSPNVPQIDAAIQYLQGFRSAHPDDEAQLAAFNTVFDRINSFD